MADEWKILKSETIDAGKNNFIEISIKSPPEGEKKYIQLSKGWMTEENEKRYKSNILFDKDKTDDIINVLKKLKDE